MNLRTGTQPLSGMLTADEARQIMFGPAVRYVLDQIYQVCCSDVCDPQISLPLDKTSELYKILNGYVIAVHDKKAVDRKLVALLSVLDQLGYHASIECTTKTNSGEYYNAITYTIVKLNISWDKRYGNDEISFV